MSSRGLENSEVYPLWELYEKYFYDVSEFIPLIGYEFTFVFDVVKIISGELDKRMIEA